MGGSVRKYVEGYKGVLTYIALAGLQGASPIASIAGLGVLPDLLNGSNANDPSQSASWNAIMVAP